MTDRATLHQGVQIGVETTAGTAVAANKKLLATTIEPAIQANVDTFRPLGGKFRTIGAIGKEWTQANISGQMVYTDIVYLLSSCMNYAAPAQQAATTAYKWTFSPDQDGVDTVKTYTVETGGSVRAHEVAYGLVTSFGYTITRDQADIRGTMMGALLTDGITMTATPTEIALQPLLPKQVDVYIDDTAANLGNTQFTRVLSVDFELSDRFGPVWPLDSSQTSYAAHVETEPSAIFKILVEADSNGMGLLTQLRNGDKRFIRVEATGPLIDSPYTYLFTHDVCGVISNVSEFRDDDGVYAVEWEFTVTYDATWTKATQIEVTNAITAL